MGTVYAIANQKGGVGKTTTIAKLAHEYKKQKKRVLICAADTFRAAAIEQLGIWAERIGVEMIRGQYNADPAALDAVLKDGAERARAIAAPIMDEVRTIVGFWRA